jgi:hypothetical protein
LDSSSGWATKNLFVALLLLAMLPGCALLTSQISVSHQLPKDLSGTTYVITPFKEQEGNPNYNAYAEAVKQQLNAKDFRETTLDQAQIVVFFAYGIDKGKGVVSSYPIIGQTGAITCSSFDGTAQSYRCLDSSPWPTWPTYGVVGTRKIRQTQYTRLLRLDIVDKQALAEGNIKKLYEGRVVSRGFSDQLAQVLPMMVKALFEDFPGQSGSTRTSSQVADSSAFFGDFL